MNLNAIEGAGGALPLSADDDTRLALAQRIREASGLGGTASATDVPGAHPVDGNGTTTDADTAPCAPPDGGEGVPGEVDVNAFFLNMFRQKMWTDWFDEGNERFEEIGAV
ncbi:hypothetical protein PMO31116_01451 [Pandoraea morbifera]|uniref:Uncharacterized protein n=1 Tax=Pandoraea morbifera TaxID=2508300 RepID=A0A5E4TJT6_9BURK|nr:hypothetical protein [Pandoraea morbifera]VVD88115.1 hypothetical protein PMO31116_01451 [Pandoraea morbifera]